jgi:hypothetical protein
VPATEKKSVNKRSIHVSCCSILGYENETSKQPLLSHGYVVEDKSIKQHKGGKWAKSECLIFTLFIDR